jgi:Carboxypeptidase regulatory-like domain/Carbohydrate binding domain/Fibronectin type III domain
MSHLHKILSIPTPATSTKLFISMDYYYLNPILFNYRVLLLSHSVIDKFKCMKKSILVLNVLVFILLTGCKNNSTDPAGGYSVSGKVYNDGQPLPNATISLDKKENYTSQTNSAGEFTIKGVPKGDYSLYVEKTNTDGSFISKTSSITVSNDLYLESILLPKGVTISIPTNITANSFHLTWTSTNANDFREYKLFRATSSGLDETTGTLVHVSTAIGDTEFTDNNLNPLTDYYYRVYIMNDYGRLGGSNIVTSLTLNKNIILNGSLEEISSNFPANWMTFQDMPVNFVVDNEVAQEGNKSIRVDLNPEDHGSNFGWLFYQIINPSEFEQGKSYKISFWCKTDSLEDNQSISFRFTKDDKFWPVILNVPYFVKGPRLPSGWEYYSMTLTIPAESVSNYFFELNIDKSVTTRPMRVWFDNLKVEKIP